MPLASALARSIWIQPDHGSFANFAGLLEHDKLGSYEPIELPALAPTSNYSLTNRTSI